jgi:predicted ABC-type exoprotein transport system permease subunit
MHNRDIKKIALSLLIVAGLVLVIITNSLLTVESRQAFLYLGFGIAYLSSVFLVETIRHEKEAAKN